MDKTDGQMLYCVTQFFEDGCSERVRTYVPAEEAISAFKHYINSVGARMGFTQRVIITDALDSINMEWINGKGIVFPVLTIPNIFTRTH